MKNSFLFIMAFLAIVSCSKFDDTHINNRLDNLEERVAKLEELCNRMNQDISSIHDIIVALQNNDYIIGVEPIKSGDGIEIGYNITFSKSGTITIYHGKNGKDGKDGKNGENGHTPIIGAKADIDGVYYWTIDGEWLLNDEGNKMPVSGKDGKDGITPQLKIENGYWYISYDNGINWTQLDKATGDNGDSFFKNITVTETNIFFTLTDGTIFLIPRCAQVAITFNISNNEAAAFEGKNISIKYSLTNATDNTVITASSDGHYSVKVVTIDKNGGEIIVTCPNPYIDGFINVMVCDNGYSIIKVINFYKGKIEFPNGLEYHIGYEEVNITIPLLHNFKYSAKVEPDAEDWLFIPQTRALVMQEDTITIHIMENPNPAERSGKVLIYADILFNEPYQDITIIQKRGIVDIPDTNFKKYLVNNFDIDGDGEISVAEVKKINKIDVSGLEIKSLQGINAMSNLNELICNNNQLTSLDLSKNLQLTILDCSYNQLTSLNISRNTQLTILNCSHNQLTSLDVSNNVLLTRLDCSYNQLTSLDISHNTLLKEINCSHNHLGTFSIVNNLRLTNFDCSDNNIEIIKVWSGFNQTNNSNFKKDDNTVYISI